MKPQRQEPLGDDMPDKISDGEYDLDQAYQDTKVEEEKEEETPKVH